MAKPDVLDLKFPLGGLNRSYAYQDQAPYTTPDALNVRPIEIIKSRKRGGTRPGLAKFTNDLLGAGNPIRLLSQVTALSVDGLQFVSDSFKGTTLGSAWAVANWGGLALPVIFPTDYSSVSFGAAATGAVRAAVANLDATKAYQIDAYLVPYLGQYWGKFQIFGRMNGSAPAATTDGFVAELVMQDGSGAYNGTLTVYNAGVATVYNFTAGNTGMSQAGYFSVLINGNNVQVFWLGVQILNQNIVVGGNAGSRAGFGMNCTGAGGVCLVDIFRVQYFTSINNQVLRNFLIASSNGTLYKSGNTFDRMIASATTLSLVSDRLLQAAERLQKLYIADNSTPRVFGTDGTIAANGTDLTAGSVADWTTKGIQVLNDVVVVSQVTGAVVAGTYQIASVQAGKLVLASSTGGAGTCTYRIEAAPKVYDPIADTLTIWAADPGLGQVPTGCPLCCTYRDRLVLAGAPLQPAIWYASRQGKPTDFNYGALANDGGRAVAGNLSDSGLIGQPIKALMPHSDDYLLFGCESSLWILRGDPAYGGQINNLSRIVGVVDKQAWCRGPNSEYVFLSRDGLYMLPVPSPMQGMYPQSLSREKLPKELLGVDPNVYTVTLEYDIQFRGVHIYLTPNNSTGQLHWWFDWELKSFWPVGLQGTHEPLATLSFNAPMAEDAGVILGCRDGYLRRYRIQAENDDGVAISNYVLLGPINLGKNGYSDGMIRELIGTLGNGSGNVNWSILTGIASELAVFQTTAAATGTFAAGRNAKFRPRARGPSMVLKLAGTGTRAWTVEEVTAVREPKGKWRPL